MHTVYYPDGHISKKDLSVLTLFTENLVLCLPGGMDPAPWVKPLLESGIVNELRTQRPYSPAVRNALTDYTIWARERAGQLRHLKGQDTVLTVNSEESRAHIARTLKGLVKQESSELKTEDWQSHLLMHLARQLDEDQSDVEDLLTKAETAGKSLADIMGVERGFKNPSQASTTPFSISGDHLMRERAAAWSYLFRDIIPKDCVLVSTRSSAHEVMLDACREILIGPESGGEFEGLKEADPIVSMKTIALPVPEKPEPDDLLAMRESWALPIRTKLKEVMTESAVSVQKMAPPDLSVLMTKLEQDLEEVVHKASAEKSFEISGACSMRLSLAPGLSNDDLLGALVSPESKNGIRPSGGGAVVLLLLDAH